MMVPVGRLVVIRTTAKTDLVRAVAYLTWPALVAPLVAPALGGVLSTYASWRLIFLVNVPLGVVALLLARRLVPDVRADEPAALDWRGFLLAAAGIAALVVGMEGVADPRPRWPVAIGALAVALVCLGGTPPRAARELTEPRQTRRVTQTERALLPTTRLSAGDRSRPVLLPTRAQASKLRLPVATGDHRLFGGLGSRAVLRRLGGETADRASPAGPGTTR